MARDPNLHRYALRGGLWIALVVLTWIAAAQLFSIAMSPGGHWQAPRIRSVKVMRTETDPQNSFTDRVIVTEGADQKLLRMLKAERAELQLDQEIKVLDNLFASAVRPAHYRLSATRLFLLFGPLLLPLLVLALWAEHRKPLLVRDEMPLPDGRTRRVLTDDFHHRAGQRHSTGSGE